MDAERHMSSTGRLCELDGVFGGTGDHIHTGDVLVADTHPKDPSNHSVDPPGEEDEPYTCCCFWRPKWAQTFLSPVFFLVCVCLVVFGDAVALGTTTGITTTIETRYRLTAANIGILVTAYGAGNMVALPFTSYFGGRPRANRPHWVASGTLVIAIGTAISSLPQFIFGKYDAGVLSNGEIDSLVCAAANNSDQCSNYHTVGAENDAAYWILFAGSVVSGMGYAAVPSLALSYIDDNCKTETTALFAGIIESMYGIGTMLGFFISSFCLSLWVDFYRLDPGTTTPSPEHPAWVGAWWLGLLICSLFFVIINLPLFGFPVRLPSRFAKEDGFSNPLKGEINLSEVEDDGEMVATPQSQESQDGATSAINSDDSDPEDGPIKGFLKTYFRLMRNPVLMLITFGMACQFAISYGFTTFLAKYLETQFEVTASFADILTGVALVPPYGIGWIMGGIIVRKTRMDFVGMFFFAMGSLLIALAGMVFLFFFGCSNPLIAGVNFGYTGQSLSEVLLVAECNVNCNCTAASYQPVCDVISDVIYISPCYAGCKDTIDSVSYHNCSCLGSGPSDSAASGLCEFDCGTLVPFLVVQVIQTAVIAVAGVPQLILLLRFVDPEDKTPALGLNRLFTSLGGLVGPLVYAAFVDHSCLVWQSVCGQQGSCLVYDIELYRNLFVGVSLALGVLAMVGACPAYYFIRRAVHEGAKIKSSLPTTDDNGKVYITLKVMKKLDGSVN